MSEHDPVPRLVWIVWAARGMGYAALGLFLVGFTPLHFYGEFMLVALGLAVMALAIGLPASHRLKRLTGGQKASGAAPAGPVTGCVVVAVGLLLLFFFVIPMLFPPPGRESGRKAWCLSNTKNIALAFQMYLEDSDGVFPPADAWCDALGDYVKNEDVFQCSKAEGFRCAFAFNHALSGVRIGDIADPDAVVAVFESPRGWNGSGGPEALPANPRHLEGDNYGLASGRALWVKRDDLARGTADIGWEFELAE